MKRRTVSMPEGVERHFWRWVRKASIVEGDGGVRRVVRTEVGLRVAGLGVEEGRDAGMGSPVGRSAIAPVAAGASSLDIVMVVGNCGYAVVLWWWCCRKVWERAGCEVEGGVLNAGHPDGSIAEPRRQLLYREPEAVLSSLELFLVSEVMKRFPSTSISVS